MYIYVCACVCVRARACVCVCARARAHEETLIVYKNKQRLKNKIITIKDYKPNCSPTQLYTNRYEIEYTL